MKSGMEMMLESMGIQTGAIKQLLDPENVKKLLTKIETMCNSIEEVKVSVQRIETKLGTLPDSVLMQLLEDGASDAFKDAAEFVKGFNNGNRGNSDNGNSDGNDSDNRTGN